ncbi:hypothetical protein GIB67_036669 [Kingdonia uniflora]|uniref:40S ribosomal protein S4 n=1 Tax=Kingdonia uniflora TaxID=39325 RepID=A0A7J7LWP3_9MAGN|nr:hypothetical protein GIB67_036669 [Kingdonia uniflora]
MARGLKKHLKRLNAPKHWMLDKLGGAFAPKPSSGPHKSRECLPLILILRNRLKYALTYREVVAILMQRHIMVDGKVRTDQKYPAGFMDWNENYKPKPWDNEMVGSKYPNRQPLPKNLLVVITFLITAPALVVVVAVITFTFFLCGNDLHTFVQLMFQVLHETWYQFPRHENFRLLYDTKGRFRLHSIKDEEAKFKLCKVRSVQFGQKGIPYINTYDGRTIRYPDPLIKANDTIKLDLESNKIIDFIKFDVGNVVMVTGGRNRGCVGVIKSWEKHKGSFETIHVQDATGHGFATRLSNVYTIGKGTKSWVSLPKGKGIKLTILEEAKKRLAVREAAPA